MPTSKRDAGARAGLLEDQRQRLAGERARGQPPAALEAGGDVQHAAQRRRVEIAQIEEVARRLPAPRSASLRAPRSAPPAAAIDRAAHFAATLAADGRQRRAARRSIATASAHSASVTTSGGDEAQHVVAGGHRQQPFGRACRLHLGLAAPRISCRAAARRRARPRTPRGSRARSGRIRSTGSGPCGPRSSRKPGASMTSSTALAAAQASGLPPNVVPCVPGT